MSATATVSAPAGHPHVAFSAPVPPAHRQAELVAGDREELIRAARAALKREAPKERWIQDPRLVARAAQSPSVEGFARDLDGDGQEELVAVVAFHARSRDKAPGPPRSELDAYVLLVTPRAPGARPYLAQVAIGAEESETQTRIELLGAVDLDGDGVDELLVHRDLWEGEVIQALIRSVGWQFRTVTLAGGGC